MCIFNQRINLGGQKISGLSKIISSSMKNYFDFFPWNCNFGVPKSFCVQVYRDVIRGWPIRQSDGLSVVTRIDGSLFSKFKKSGLKKYNPDNSDYKYQSADWPRIEGLIRIIFQSEDYSFNPRIVYQSANYPSNLWIIFLSNS